MVTVGAPDPRAGPPITAYICVINFCGTRRSVCPRHDGVLFYDLFLFCESIEVLVIVNEILQTELRRCSDVTWRGCAHKVV